MVRLKICDCHLTCKVAKKCLNVCERAEVVAWNKMIPFLPLLFCELSVSVKKNPDRKKNQSPNRISWWKQLNKASASFPANIHLFKVNSRSTRQRCEICSKLTVKTPERRLWRRSCVFIVSFEHISYLFLVFLLLVLSK